MPSLDSGVCDTHRSLKNGVFLFIGNLPLAALRRETIWVDAAKYEDVERQYQEERAQGDYESDLVNRVHSLEGEKDEMEQSKDAWIVDAAASNHFTNNKDFINFVDVVNENMVLVVNGVEFPINGNEKGMKHRKTNIYTPQQIGAFERLNRTVIKRARTVLSESGLDKSFRPLCSSKMSKKMEEISKKLDELTLNSGLKIRTDKHQSGLPIQNKLNVNEPAEDDDIDLFGSDEETDEDKRIKEERLKAYENKKAKKPALVAKSSVVLDVKPWSDETDMKELEIAVREIAMDGLTWGASKLVPLAYGIRKLQIIAIVEDAKVSVDGLQESIEEIEDLVQSVDIAAFNKL
ncbi:elongation factor 1-beta [Trichonephila clavata]|uniref:Elongation factor 1-beta n=1 Tax=Trichonephila clavata TaxID=2740835 RepID=A0A8X6IE18_TRICU|nr:elongation factor 1-beta [Trichonephila clavata]